MPRGNSKSSPPGVTASKRVGFLKTWPSHCDVDFVSSEGQSPGGRILVLDDSKAMGGRIASMLEHLGYTTTVCQRGVEAIQMLKASHIDVMTCDIEMPEMSGLQVLRLARSVSAELPILMITSNGELRTALEAMRLGAYDYLVKPFKPSDIRDKIERGFQILEASRHRERQILKLRERIEERERQINEGKEELRRIKRVFKKGVLDGLGISVNILGRHNEALAEHSRRVGDLALRVGAKLKLSADELMDLHAAGLLHDIGMLALSPDIASAIAVHGDLSASEVASYQRHCEIGTSIVEGIDRFREVSAIILAHHEYIDGSGFPGGLLDQQIPLAAKILAAVEDLDTYRSMSQPPEAWQDPIARIRQLSGIKYAPDVVAALLEAVEDEAHSSCEIIELAINELAAGMKLATDICTKKGVVLVGRGQLLSADVIEKVGRLLSLESESPPLIQIEKQAHRPKTDRSFVA